MEALWLPTGDVECIQLLKLQQFSPLTQTRLLKLADLWLGGLRTHPLQHSASWVRRATELNLMSRGGTLPCEWGQIWLVPDSTPTPHCVLSGTSQRLTLWGGRTCSPVPSCRFFPSLLLASLRLEHYGRCLIL